MTPAPRERIEAIEEAIAHMPSGSVLLLENVSQEGYEQLLAELGDDSRVRLTYDNGRLEIMSPSDKHEYLKSLIGHLIGALTEELDLKYISIGSTTLRRGQTSQGTEPDDCFYITNAERVIGKGQIDLNVDPPPDLAVEIDISNRSQTKFPVYASLGVPEIWQYKDGHTLFYNLTENGYQEIPASDLFPFLTPDCEAFPKASAVFIGRVIDSADELNGALSGIGLILSLDRKSFEEDFEKRRKGQ